MRILFVFIFISLSLQNWAQYGNEWIEYDQKYYSFKINEDGIYKIDYTTLLNNGLPLTSITSENIQLFAFEKEQPIQVIDGNDNSMDPGDYILFYAKKNTIWLDSILYENSDDISNLYVPHYNDTITYFLTWNNQTNNRRIIEETDINFSSHSVNPYVLNTTATFFKNHYSEGFKNGGLSYSQFVSGEGWSSNFVNALSSNNGINTNIDTRYSYSGIDAPLIKAHAISSSGSNASFTGLGNHHLQIINAKTSTVFIDTIFIGYQNNEFNFEFPVSEIVSNSTNIRHEFINDQGAASDYQAVHFVELTYPRQPNLGGAKYIEIKIINGNNGKSYNELLNFGGTTPLAFSIGDQIRRIPIIKLTNRLHSLVPNSSSDNQKLIILDQTKIIPVVNLNPINNTGKFIDYSQLNFEGAYLLISHPILWQSAQSYKSYRSSIAGGSHNCQLINIESLDLQFGGGVPKHIAGLRRFQHFVFNKTAQKPNQTFLLGKGIREANEGASGPGMRFSISSYAQCLIPSYGYPASDNLITHSLEGNGITPLIPVGRLAATNNLEVINYLNKVKEYDLAQIQNSGYTIEEKQWQKEILHFGGGSTGLEQNLFKTYLTNYERILENENFGGHVSSYFKTVSDPINPVSLAEVNDRINEGVSFMTFFGHASATGFDQNVDDPNNWKNKGKYPIVIGNSCLTGNIHEPLINSASENFVLTDEKGAIAFMANVKQGFPQSLNTFSTQFFSQVSNSNYGESLGKQLSLVNSNLSNLHSSFHISTTLSQMTLHGDPALIPNFHKKPELLIEPHHVFVTPEKVDLTIDSITLNIILNNLGKSITDTFNVEVIRHYPNNNSDSLYQLFVPKLHYKDTVKLTIPLHASKSVGINSFEVKVDLPNVIEEQVDEIFNNQTSKQFIFDIDGVFPIWPYNYAVVPEESITLKASTINPFAEINSYRFEIDTTDLFNSPFLKHSNITSVGGVLEVRPNQWFSSLNINSPLVLKDSTVYFWRVSIEHSNETTWHEFSFQYIQGKTGWGQNHFYQFKNNDFSFLNYDRTSRSLKYKPASKTIHCQTYGNASNNSQFYGTLWEIDGELQDYTFCNTNPKLLVCVIDPVTLLPWATQGITDGVLVNQNHNFGNSNDHYGSNNCRSRPFLFFSFEQNSPIELAALENMITNEIPDGHHVLIYTARFLNYPEWDTHYPQLYSFFQSIGSDSIKQGKSKVPYISFFEKGDINTYQEVYGQNLNEYIEFNDTIWGFDYTGYETSTIIGPAKNWGNLYWQLNTIDNPSSDSARLKLYGNNTSLNKRLIMDTILVQSDSIINLNSISNINSYNTLQLEVFSLDDENFTPIQIKSWHILYEPVPEAALSSISGLYFPKDSIQEGDQIIISADILNISDYDMDSILVNYWIEKNNHQLLPLKYPRQDSLRINNKIRDTLTINSIGLSKLNNIWIEVNPFQSDHQLDQPEMYHFNNLGQLPFKVENDMENPILQVTFDNQFILNGDLVSPFSEVVISLKDDNPFLLLNKEEDTALFGIYLTDPFGHQKQIYFKNNLGEQNLEWIPANAQNKKFKIIYNGDFEADGKYQLLVQGADKSGNNSGDYDYNIEFEIDHHSSITNLMNYPNPFSTSTQFVFTLSGAIIPDELTIQILTVTGRLVRTITKDELGSIRIGRNLTDYKWNGKDEFGDQLANGIYLYRVLSSINNESIDHRASGADKYFTKGFGKMYLLR